MNLPSVSHATIANTLHFLGNAIESNFIQGTDRLPMKLRINLFFIMVTVTNFLNIYNLDS
jgi:hypothetical protein